jgi:phage shock protein PspC (stress-responsive transcriptional regulator)
MTTTTHPKADLHDNSLAGARAWFERTGLSRPREGRVLGGVAATFARRYDVDPLIARLLTIAAIVVLTPLVVHRSVGPDARGQRRPSRRERRLTQSPCGRGPPPAATSRRHVTMRGGAVACG